jgi:hypothetical protein
VSSGSTASATITATKILDHINKLSNTNVTDESVGDITTSIRSLSNYCNTKFLKDFPIDIVYTSNDTVPIQFKSWYFPNLSQANLSEYVINTFENLERNSYSTYIEESSRCIDAIQVLIDYSNVVILSRTDHYLGLYEKELDGFEQSSNSVETST